MKIKRAAAIILACAMLMGQVAYADEYVGDDAYDNYVGDDVYDTSFHYSGVENISALYTNYPRVDGVQITNPGERTDFRIESADASIVEVHPMKETDDGTMYYTFFGKAEGETDVFLTYAVPGEEERRQEKMNTITVTALPDDAVPMDDAVLISKLVTGQQYLIPYYPYDLNGDGYINQTEMERITAIWFERLPYSSLSIQNMNGLQYAELTTLRAENQSELTDITALGDCEKLETLILQGASKLTDISAVGNCKNLKTINLGFAAEVETFDILQECTNLEDVVLYDIPQLTDIHFLQNCANLQSVNLAYTNVSNIDALFDKSLHTVNLEGTAVSGEDRLRLAGLKDGLEIYKGEKRELLQVGGAFGDEFSIEKKGGTGGIHIEEAQNGNCYVVAATEGQVQNVIQYDGGSIAFAVNIQGIPTKQDVGAAWEEEVTISSSDPSLSEAEASILSSSGALWKTYPEIEKVSDHAKEYVSGWVYDTSEKEYEINTGEWVECWLDTDGTLWNGKEKIAENIVKFDGRYALDTNGTLTNLHHSGQEKIENVKDWYTTGNYSSSSSVTTQILKTDGTLWEKTETSKEQPTDELVKIADNVREIRGGRYITNDDVCVSGSLQLDDVAAFAGNETYLSGNYVYNTDGELEFIFPMYAADNPRPTYVVGNVGVVKDLIQKMSNTETILWILNEQNQLYLYRHSSTGGELKLLSENAEKLNEAEDKGTWAAKLQDGTYYGMDGEVIYPQGRKELILKEYSVYSVKNNCSQNYSLVLDAVGAKMVWKNGMDLLDEVENIWKNNGTNTVYALRTDGTIWDITTIPTKIIDLAADDFQKGDVNEDNSVDIQDLRTILRYVCGKTTLNERQLKIADVVGDGAVDIQDLRKVLRFVCGKLDSLE